MQALFFLASLLSPIARSEDAARQTGAKAVDALPPPPDQQELWVPTNRLKEVLAHYPKAVVLSREQYDMLLRDAEHARKPAAAAPRSVTISSAQYHARLEGKSLQVTAEFVGQVLTDDWTQAPLSFGTAKIGAVRIDGEAAWTSAHEPRATTKAAAPKQARESAPTMPMLLLHGRGERRWEVDFSLPIVTQPGSSEVELALPSVAASRFDLDLPPALRVESPQPIAVHSTPTATVVSAALRLASPTLKLTWRSAGIASAQAALDAKTTLLFDLDAERISVEEEVKLTATLGVLPLTLRIAAPAKARVLSVEGNDVARWTLNQNIVAVEFQPGERSATDLRVRLELPSLGITDLATVDLELPILQGVGRVSGEFAIVADRSVTAKAVTVEPSVAQLAGAMSDGRAGLTGSYSFSGHPSAPHVVLERVQPSFNADIDTLVEFKPDAIFLERIITLHQEKGERFRVLIGLPAGEELLSVRRPDDTEPDWEMSEGKVALRWSVAATAQSEPTFKLRTRTEPAKWAQLDAAGLSFTLNDVKIQGVHQVTGYIALKADETFRLEAEPSETLERRDGRTTPVQGDYAWFRRDLFGLSVKVAKRPAEILATVTGYALPLEGVLDLHAQVAFEFLHSGARSVRLKVPEKLAANFYFDGPQIAERNLVGDTWTIVFQKDLTGSYVLQATAQVPVVKSEQAPADRETHFAIQVPVITPLDSPRISGVWAVEANTETEITFTTKAMNELDSLLAPALAGYQPRHRVIGVFTWLGPDYTLQLTGVRHVPAAVLTSVVDRLDLDTVISTSGSERNEARFQLRTAGAQYLEVMLPPTSRVLSLSVDQEMIKPVGDRPGVVRIQLPARRDANEALSVTLLYERSTDEWRRRGDYTTPAPRLAKDIPILQTQWRLFLPDGFEYSGLESNLRVPEDSLQRPMLLQAFVKNTELPEQEFEKEMTPVERAKQAQAERDAVKVEQLSKRLEQHIIPKLDFRDITMREALANINRGLNVNFIVQDDPITPPGGVQLSKTPITVRLTNIPASEALRYVTNLSGMKFKIEPDAVLIVPASANTDVFVTKEFSCGIDVLGSAQGLLVGPLGFGKLVPAKEWLIANGVQFSPTASAYYSPEKRKLIIRNTQEQLDLMETIVASGQGTDGGVAPTKEEIESKTEATRSKLEKHVFPKLEFTNTPARQAVEYILHDTGISALWLTEPSAVPGLGTGADSSPEPMSISLSLTNVPATEALRYVTNLVGYHFSMEPGGVVIRPASQNTDVLVTKEFTLDPAGALFSAPAGRESAAVGGSGIATRERAKDALAGHGVEFGPNASAIYIPSSNKLVVRNTSEQLDLVELLVTESKTQRRDAQRVAGLLPLKLDLPRIGHVVIFAGLSAPMQISVRYEDWWTRARRLWLWFVGGGLLAVRLARRHAWWRTAWAMLLLTCWPLVISPASTPVCNALLGGWLLGLVAERVARRWILNARTMPRRQEVHA